MQSTHVGEARGSIWRLADGDIETVVAFSVAAWAPVFASLKTELGSEIFGATFPDWRSSQAAGVEAVCTAPGKDVWVAVAEDRPVGFTLCASTCRVRISHSEPSIMYVSSPTRSEPRETTSAGASFAATWNSVRVVRGGVAGARFGCSTRPSRAAVLTLAQTLAPAHTTCRGCSRGYSPADASSSGSTWARATPRASSRSTWPTGSPAPACSRPANDRSRPRPDRRARSRVRRRAGSRPRTHR